MSVDLKAITYRWSPALQDGADVPEIAVAFFELDSDGAANALAVAIEDIQALVREVERLRADVAILRGETTAAVEAAVIEEQNARDRAAGGEA